MTDFTTLGTTGKTGFTHTEQREVVMQHERVFVFAINRIDQLRITGCTQGGGYDGLCFTTCEQG